MIVIGILSLRQCLIWLSPLTAISASGMSRKLPLCIQVSHTYNGEWLDVTWAHATVWLEGSGTGLGWWWWCDVKMAERWCWGMQEIECNPMAQYDSVSDLWPRVVFLWDVLMIFYGFWPFWDFLMKFSLCFLLHRFLMRLLDDLSCSLLDNFLMKFHAFLAVMRPLWDFMLFITSFILIYVRVSKFIITMECL